MKVITNKIIKNFENYLYEEEKSNNTIEKYLPIKKKSSQNQNMKDFSQRQKTKITNDYII